MPAARTGALHTLTPAEQQIISAGASDPNLVLGYFFRRRGAETGFQLDYNFREGGKWQKDVCMASQTFIVAIGGIGTGKTLGVGMAAMYHAICTPGFKFLNIARESWQSTLMYNALLEFITDTPAEDLVVSTPRRPYPQIVIEYIVAGRKVRSTLEFMSVGEEGDATNIFSWRGDWINIEEGGRLDNLADIVANLSTRLTGATAERRPFMGRMSVISNPWDTPDLWQLFDMAYADNEDGLAININTIDNMNVTEKQRENALKLIPERERERFMTGNRPEGRGTYFPAVIVRECESAALSQEILEGVAEKKPGYVADHLPHLNYFHFQAPPVDGRVYFLLGDPGAGTAPARNAPVVMVFDVTEAPKFVFVRAMWWGSGMGSITPFLSKLIEWVDFYRPIFAGVDNTATQKHTAEIVNMQFVHGQGKSIESIFGMDFSGSRRYSYLLSLKLFLESRNFFWPSIATGIGSQLKSYDPLLDRAQTARLAQDIVVTMAMAAFAIRARYGQADAADGDDARAWSKSDALAFQYARENGRAPRDPRRNTPPRKTQLRAR